MPRSGAPADSPSPIAILEERRSRYRLEGQADEVLERRTALAHPAGPIIQTILPIARPVPEPDMPYDPAPKRPEAPKPTASATAESSGREALLVASAWSDQWQAELEKLRELQRWSDAPEPTIQVTIGRVEVRAEAPSVPREPKPRAKTPAVMSLDDYLNQRKGRGSL
jgi:hypothetical protein